MFKPRKLQILLFLMVICLITLLAQSLWSFNTDIPLTSESAQEWKAPGDESFDQDANLIAAGNDYEERTTPKLPFSLDRFGDYEPLFLSQKVIPIKSKRKFSQNNPKMAKIDLNHIAKQAIKSSSRRSISISSSANDKDEEKARVISIWQRLKQINARNPLERLPPIVLNQSKISRIYLLTYFRSGSSFLGELLQQAFRTFYLFEPLHFQTSGVRLSDHDSRVPASTQLVLDMIERCDFRHAHHYLTWMSIKQNQFLLKWNRLLWNICHTSPARCYEADFVSQVCKRSAHRVVKLTRLSMHSLLTALSLDSPQEEISIHSLSSNQTLRSIDQTSHRLNQLKYLHELSDSVAAQQIDRVFNADVRKEIEKNHNSIRSTNETVNSQVLYLVRDPRAVYASRKHLQWCQTSDCSSIETICREMVQDIRSLQSYQKSWPNETKRIQIKMIRFEDLALRPVEESKQLYQSLNLPFTATIERYVRSHTGEGLSWNDSIQELRNQSTTSTSTSTTTQSKRNQLDIRLAKLAHLQLTRENRNPHSTKRESKRIPFAWHKSLDWNQVQQVQDKCGFAMEQFGYRSITENQFKQTSFEFQTLLQKPLISFS